MSHHEKRLVVTRSIDAPASEIFEVLTRPQRHVELDG